MGKSASQAAADRFRPEVRKVIADTLKQQKSITKSVNKQTVAYRGGAPMGTGKVQKQIGKASGSTFPQYVKQTEGRFYGGTSDVANAYRQVLRNFSPNLIGSPSQRGTDFYLRGLRGEYGTNIQELGEAGRDRLYDLPEQARTAFTASELNPAFNNLRNEQYMELAQNPPTVSNNAMAMYRDLFTYNV